MEKEPIIKHHAELAKYIAGKKILHLCSLGKDATLCLSWIVEYAKIEEVISVFFKFHASHPDDDRYLEYLKKRFPTVKFIVLPDPIELSQIAAGVFQYPTYVLKDLNHWEYDGFSRDKVIEELMKEHGCDYMCSGASKYESFARRTKFHQKGLVFNKVIYPIGMFSRDQVIGAIKAAGLKIHPCYKYSKSGYDNPSYWKMRYGMIANPEYEKRLMETYPLLALDKYRYEAMLKPNGYFDLRLLYPILVGCLFMLGLTYLMERF